MCQVDERVAPAGDADRNLTHLRESLMGCPASCSSFQVISKYLDSKSLFRTGISSHKVPAGCRQRHSEKGLLMLRKLVFTFARVQVA